MKQDRIKLAYYTCKTIFNLVTQATVRSKAPLGGYIQYTMGNKNISRKWRINGVIENCMQDYTAVFQQRAVIHLWWPLWKLYYLERFV